MVDLDPVDAEDAKVLQDMIMKHYAYTGSTVAKFRIGRFREPVEELLSKYSRPITRK